MFNTNKSGIVWTSAFITFTLANMLDGNGVVLHGACMIMQTMLLFLFLWLHVKSKQMDRTMKKLKDSWKNAK